MADIKTKFGERIQELRNRKEIKQQTLADRMDVDRTYISKIENGKKNPTLEIIHELSEQLDTPLREVFDFR
jgi:transcriptional regulator with XRE-family HTH domain